MFRLISVFRWQRETQKLSTVLIPVLKKTNPQCDQRLQLMQYVYPPSSSLFFDNKLEIIS